MRCRRTGRAWMVLAGVMLAGAQASTHAQATGTAQAPGNAQMPGNAQAPDQPYDQIGILTALAPAEIDLDVVGDGDKHQTMVFVRDGQTVCGTVHVRQMVRVHYVKRGSKLLAEAVTANGPVAVPLNRLSEQLGVASLQRPAEGTPSADSQLPNAGAQTAALSGPPNTGRDTKASATGVASSHSSIFAVRRGFGLERSASVREQLSLREQLAEVLPAQYMSGGRVSVDVSGLLFEPGSGVLKESGAERLGRLAGVLNGHPGVQISLAQPYADGEDPAELEADKKRLKTVGAFFAGKGYPAKAATEVKRETTTAESGRTQRVSVLLVVDPAPPR